MSNPQPQQQGASWQVYAAILIALYQSAESQLLHGVSWILRRVPKSYAGQLQAGQLTRRLVRQVVAQLDAHTTEYVNAIIAGAVDAVPPAAPPGRPSGSTAAPGGPGAPRRPSGHSGDPGGPDLPGGLMEPPGGSFPDGLTHAERAAKAIRDDLLSDLQDVRRRITRLDDDVYKLVGPQGGLVSVLDNGATLAQAQALTWREFVRRGVTGFTDKSGRNWSLSAYVEMAVRTASQRAYNESHLQVIRAAGGNLVTVSDDGAPCPLCLPWQNRVLCIVPDGVHPSIADAIAAGLLHPNCRHTWNEVTEYSRLPAARDWTPKDQARYDLTQKQRRLELAVRKAKAELEYARTAEQRQTARDDVRKAQKRVREFVNANADLKRQSRREQLHLADDRMKVPELS